MLSLSCGAMFSRWRMTRLNCSVAASAAGGRFRARSAGSCASSSTALAIRQHSALPATARARSRLA